jgi:type I restriction enzyme R subunit
VQTLSRLNRARPQKTDTFVLDFLNDVDTIKMAFADYYRTTILSDETDPNKLHDLKATLDSYQVYAWVQVEHLVELFLGGADRDKLDPILDACVAVYTQKRRVKFRYPDIKRLSSIYLSPAPWNVEIVFGSCPL